MLMVFHTVFASLLRLDLFVTGINKIVALQFNCCLYPAHVFIFGHPHQDGRVVKALDLRSNGHMSAWVRTPLLVDFLVVF